MVMNMIEKKDPHQKTITDDPSDDDDIIELTDEVITKPQENDRTAGPQKSANISAQTAKTESLSDDGDDIIDLKDTHETELSEDEDFIDRDDPVADERIEIEEDEAIASAIEESLGADEDELDAEKIRPTDESDLESQEDESGIILDTGDDDLAAPSDPDAAVMQKAEDVFDAEEEIELEYESDEDEYDFFALDDQKTLEDLETISMIDEEPDEDVDDDIRFDPVAGLDIDSDEDDEIITLDPDQHEGPDEDVDDDIRFDPVAGLDIDSDEDDEIITLDPDQHEGPDLMALEDKETLEFEDSSDVPDLTDEMDFEFEDDEDESVMAAEEELSAKDSDDIIARTVEKSLTQEEANAQIDLAMEREFEPPDDNGIMAKDDAPQTAEDIIAALAQEDTLKFEEDEELSDIEDDIDPEPAYEVLHLNEFDDDTTEEEDDIIEITEFDEHFPKEAEKKLERAGVLDAAEPDEEEFLELIEVEDDGQTEDEEIIEVNQSEEQIVQDEIDNFFSETLGEEPEFESDDTQPVEETPAMDTMMTMDTLTPPSEDEEFNFSFDPSQISQKVDRLDTFLSSDSTTEPEMALQPEDQFEDDENAEEDQQAVQDTGDAPAVTPDQINSLLERVIKEKFSGKIEDIIYEAIEKAVSKEIDRLKGSLLDRTGLGDDE